MDYPPRPPPGMIPPGYPPPGMPPPPYGMVAMMPPRPPYAAQAESRTAGNMLGQSWGLLNCRAGSEVMNKVRNSKYALSIKPCGQIHDALYFYVFYLIDK